MADELLSPEEMNDLLKQGAESAEKAERTREKKAEVSSETEQSAEIKNETESGQVSEAQGDTAQDIRLYPGVEQVRPVQFSQLASSPVGGTRSPLDLILDVDLQVTVELGRTTMQVRDILDLCPGSVVELQKLSGEPVELIVNNKLVARGEVVVIDENFGIRVTEIVSQAERVSSLK